MKLTRDTNVLVRFIVNDDAAQAVAAKRTLEAAEIIVLPNACLCELVWVLRRSYRFERDDILAALRMLSSVAGVVMDRPAVSAGLTILEAGGDFADGLIAHEGAMLGGETFVSFDRRAVALVARHSGIETQLLTG